MDFHLSIWRLEREREWENFHVDIRSLIFLLFQNFPVRLLTGKSNDKQSNRPIIANAAFLLFLISQSNTSLFALLCSRFRLAKYNFPVCPVPILSIVNPNTVGTFFQDTQYKHKSNFPGEPKMVQEQFSRRGKMY